MIILLICVLGFKICIFVKSKRIIAIQVTFIVGHLKRDRINANNIEVIIHIMNNAVKI